MSFSNYCENYLLNQLFTNKTVYVGYGVSGTETGVTEPVALGYIRKAYGAWTLTNVADGLQQVTNNAAIIFDAATGSQGTVTHVGFWDAETNGNFLGMVSFAELGLADINVITGTQVQFDAGNCKCKLD